MPDGFGGEMGRVMIDTDAYPALILSDVEDSVGDRLAKFLVEDVVDVDGFWLSLSSF
jgi:hypothetical protein